jgi:hypothetical protein
MKDNLLKEVQMLTEQTRSQNLLIESLRQELSDLSKVAELKSTS